MTTLTFALLVAGGSVTAGLLGALTGLGGGIIVVPMLTLLFHVDLRYAIGASLVSVIATSSGAAAAYVREGYTNVRVGILLEVATTIGALAGAGIAGSCRRTRSPCCSESCCFSQRTARSGRSPSARY